MTTDTFFMNVDKYGVLIPLSIAILFLLTFYYIFRQYIYKNIKKRLHKKGKDKKQDQDYKLHLGYGLNSLGSAIPLLITVIVVRNYCFSSFFISFYKKNSENNIVLVFALFLLILISPFIFFWLKLSIRLIYNDIRGFIVYSFLPIWFKYKKKKYSENEYTIFLKNCISWSNKEKPKLSEYANKRYLSPFAMISYINIKLFLKRNSIFRSFAKKELKKIASD